jgi:hypothetical protein
MSKRNITNIKGDKSMEVSDPMPKDKRTVAYKEWKLSEDE